METTILPRLESFGPDLIVISAGFDAHMRDPLANINLAEADFVWATQKLMDLADTCAGGRVVSLLEGFDNVRLNADLAGIPRVVSCQLLP